MSIQTYNRLRASNEQTDISRGYWFIAWALLVAFFVIGDSVTTYYGVYHNPAVVESHPVSQVALGVGGMRAMLLLKGIVMAITAVLAKTIGNDYVGIAAPLGPAALGFVVTTWNVLVLFVFAP